MKTPLEEENEHLKKIIEDLRRDNLNLIYEAKIISHLTDEMDKKLCELETANNEMTAYIEKVQEYLYKIHRKDSFELMNEAPSSFL